MAEIWIVAILFLLISSSYALVGFGGGSSYIALLSFLAFPQEDVRLIALTCNILVVASSIIIFIQKNKKYEWDEVAPYVILSIPLAFIGGYITLNPLIFKLLLGFSLFFSGTWIFLQSKNKTRKKQVLVWWLKMLIGGGIGFFASLIGIGGGIFLSPILLLLGKDARKVAIITASFILVNSSFAIIGKLSKAPDLGGLAGYWPLALMVILGAQLGSRLRTKLLNPKWIKRTTAILVLLVALQLLRSAFLELLRLIVQE